MEKGIFKLDTKKSIKKNFLERIKIPFYGALLLTGIFSAMGIMMVISALISHKWKVMGVAQFVQIMFSYLIIICIFISLIKILIDEKPFSKTLCSCMRIISLLYIGAAILFQFLPGYESSGNTIFFVEAEMLLKCLLIYVFSILIEEGFKMQKELDEIL